MCCGGKQGKGEKKKKSKRKVEGRTPLCRQRLLPGKKGLRRLQTRRMSKKEKKGGEKGSKPLGLPLSLCRRGKRKREEKERRGSFFLSFEGKLTIAQGRRGRKKKREMGRELHDA